MTPATWNKGWAALKHFYKYSCEAGWIEDTPVRIQDRLDTSSQIGGFREKNARLSRDRWLTPAEYSMWRDVGLLGYSGQVNGSMSVVADSPNVNFRGRNSARNAAYTDYVLSTGLRAAEAGSLLRMELPIGVNHQVPIVTKGRLLRHYVPMHVYGLESVQQYVDGERYDNVRRAQEIRRYDGIADPLIIERVLPDGPRGQRLRLENYGEVDVPMLSHSDRIRLYGRTEHGLEPAALWLGESGMPMQPASWNAVFAAANRRVTAARTALGVRAPWVRVTPHSLRFTFALMVLVAGVRATDREQGLTPSHPFLEGNYSHVFDEVRDLLGHASVETTKNIYLEPVKRIRRSSLFTGDSIAEVWSGIRAFSPLVGFRSAD
ncbi:hypothetical protein [Arthrobacter sp. JZ12]|uniref:hypothetical protein n=1 Tax=Arthrobacter sp. JZ12 TaxID=2654190 RepID=UPI003A5D0CE4